MNIEDLKDSELITELYERMTAPKESNIDRMIREAFERIDNIIKLACDDLDDLKKKYQKPIFTYTDKGGLANASALYNLEAAQQQRAFNIADQMSGFPYPTGNGIFGGLGMAVAATGFLIGR